MAGIRDSKTVDGVEYNYLTLDGKVVRQTWGNNTLDIIYDNSGLPYAFKYNGGYYIYVLNQQGDVIRIVNSTGATVAEYRYDAWGNVIYSSGSMAAVNPIRYRGYFYDSETGFYYLQSRYYDPSIGRFINADSLIPSGNCSALSFNLFAYCVNNPVNLNDDGGNWPKLSTFFCTLALTAVAVAAVAVTVGACAIVAPAVVAVGNTLVASSTVVATAVAVATEALTTAAIATAATVVSDKIEREISKTYTVYFLEDSSGTIRYVGRVEDSGFNSRMAHHYATRGLTPKYKATGLNYFEARGLEEIGIIECHTLNKLYPENNQIHGISPRNKKGQAYMNAATDYLLNRAENWLLNLIS